MKKDTGNEMEARIASLMFSPYWLGRVFGQCCWTGLVDMPPLRHGCLRLPDYPGEWAACSEIVCRT